MPQSPCSLNEGENTKCETMPVLSTDDGTAQFNAGCLRSQDLAKIREPVFQALKTPPWSQSPAPATPTQVVRAVCDVKRVCTVQVEDIVPGVAVNVQNRAGTAA